MSVGEEEEEEEKMEVEEAVSRTGAMSSWCDV